MLSLTYCVGPFVYQGVVPVRYTYEGGVGDFERFARLVPPLTSEKLNRYHFGSFIARPRPRPRLRPRPRPQQLAVSDHQVAVIVSNSMCRTSTHAEMSPVSVSGKHAACLIWFPMSKIDLYCVFNRFQCEQTYLYYAGSPRMYHGR